MDFLHVRLGEIHNIANPHFVRDDDLQGAAIGGGILALLLERAAMTFATAAVGAWIAVYMAAFIVLGLGVEPYLDDPAWQARAPWILAGCWMLLAVTGALVQFRMRRRQKER